MASDAVKPSPVNCLLRTERRLGRGVDLISTMPEHHGQQLRVIDSIDRVAVEGRGQCVFEPLAGRRPAEDLSDFVVTGHFASPFEIPPRIVDSGSTTCPACGSGRLRAHGAPRFYRRVKPRLRTLDQCNPVQPQA